LYRGTRVRLTKTIDFEGGLVNGVDGEVLEIAVAGITLRLISISEIVTIWRTPRELLSAAGIKYNRSAYEITLAYATTVHQVEGQSLDEVCIVFEQFCPPGWAYTALTRARTRAKLRIIGHPVSSHFLPRI
jgi:ATP-dependent exoDNAse (exonuclease V) alpha subunit